MSQVGALAGLLVAAGVAGLLLLGQGCRRGGSLKEEYPAGYPRPDFPTSTLTIVSGDRRIPLEVLVAASNNHRAYGMMFTKTPLRDDQGMIFIYPEPRELGFWMRNTRLPLDLVYIGDDGRIINAHREMVPLDDDRTYPALRSCRFALELRGGWLEDHGVWIDDRIELSDELLAIEAEPMDPNRGDIPQLVRPR